MLKQQQQQFQRESSPIAQDLPMSPTSRRRAEFTIKNLQNGVMGRARSTLTSLGDVWRPKVGSPPPQRSTKVTSLPMSAATVTAGTTAGNNRTLDFLTTYWSRQKKMENISKSQLITAVSQDNLSQPMEKVTKKELKMTSLPKKIFAWNKDKQILYDQANSSPILNNAHIKERNTGNRSSKKMSGPQSTKPTQRRISRNLSLELDLGEKPSSKTNSHSHENSPIPDHLLVRRNSCINDYVMSADIESLDFNVNRQFLSPTDLIITNKTVPKSKPNIEDGTENVIKARLKLKKLMAQDDLVLNNRSHENANNATQQRHNSSDPKISKTSISLEKLLAKERDDFEEQLNQLLKTKIDRKSIKESKITPCCDSSLSKLIQNPKKKLSFRDPLIAPKQLNLKSNSLPKANEFLEEYERRRTYSFDYEQESQAMRIVRTVGQAFEVCHKFNLQNNSLNHNDEHSDTPCDISDRCSERITDEDEPKKDPLPVTPEPSMKRPNHLDITPVANFNFRKSFAENDDKLKINNNQQINPANEMQQMREQLEQQTIQTRQALGQLMLVREQLITETNARIEAQARTQQLLQQNRELLEHLASLGGYTDADRPALTTTSLGLAPQTTLPKILAEPDSGSPVRKNFLATPNSNNMSSINQQLNSLGSINQQLSTLSLQLCGLNQQSQNLQNFQNIGSSFNLRPTTPIPQLNNNITSPDIIQQDLFQSNQELLNRLQNLSLGYSNNNSINNYSPQNSFIYTNPNQLSPNNNINLNLLNSPSSVGNLTPSPILNRSSYSSSPLPDDSLAISMERHLDRTGGGCGGDAQFIKPLSQVSTITTLDSDGKVKVVVPVSTDSLKMEASSSLTSSLASSKKSDKKVTLPDFVTLKVTDESGNITNSRKLSATPSFIQRSTSEKVPNRSQMMSEVHRTTWARHTTK